MKQISRLPDAELEVMQALWTVPEYPARTSDLAARLDRDWKAPTLLKLLSRLEERGFVRGEKEGRSNGYTPLVNRPDYLAAESRSFLERVHGGDLLDKPMGGLSGGQLQRVLLAMALEPLPHILILDEPLSGVDIEGEHQLLEMLDEIRTSYDLSIFLSTHDFATLGQFADKVILLNRRVLKSGPPDEVLSSPEFYETFHLRVGKGGQA